MLGKDDPKYQTLLEEKPWSYIANFRGIENGFGGDRSNVQQ
jgi:hypothetical protein